MQFHDPQKMNLLWAYLKQSDLLVQFLAGKNLTPDDLYRNPQRCNDHGPDGWGELVNELLFQGAAIRPRLDNYFGIINARELGNGQLLK